VELTSDFLHPPLAATPESLRDHFARLRSQEPAPLRNPHHEPRVDAAARSRATPAAVLIPVVLRTTPTLLLTRRHADISFGGHVAFPGGRCDPTDAGPEATALREAEEEVALPQSQVEVLGRLGDYVTHSGFRIAPVVGLVTTPLDLHPRPGEVDAIFEVPLAVVLDARAYRLRGRPGTQRAHFSLASGEHEIAGPTVSLMMGLYETLLSTHPPDAGPGARRWDQASKTRGSRT
jgi:8-oxo-dGTP pyrophosphatase MutT (NUDIX family)